MHSSGAVARRKFRPGRPGLADLSTALNCRDSMFEEVARLRLPGILCQMGADAFLEIFDRHRLALRRNGKPGPSAAEFRAFPCADFGNVAQRFAGVSDNDVATALFVVAHPKLAVKHTDQRAELDPVSLDKKELAFPDVEPGNIGNLQRYLPHSPAQKL